MLEEMKVTMLILLLMMMLCETLTLLINTACLFVLLSMCHILQSESVRRKSLLDPQTLLLLKSQEESHM